MPKKQTKKRDKIRSECSFATVLSSALDRVKERVKTVVELTRQLNEVRLELHVGSSGKFNREQVSNLLDHWVQDLSLEQLEVLDGLLRKQGTSLSAVFGGSFLADVLSEKGQVLFIIGSAPDPNAKRIDLSRWDVRALRELLNALKGSDYPVGVSFEDVIFRTSGPHEFSREPVAANEVWYHELLHPTEPNKNIVCLGSPKANHAAEVMLAEMYGVDRFQPWPGDRPRPFYFVFPEGDERATKISSAFIRLSSELKRNPQFAKVLASHRGEMLGFWHQGRLYWSRRGRKQSKSYGVIVIQRRASNVWWCAICGLTGGGTLGTAKYLEKIRVNLADSGPIVIPVEVDVIDEEGKTEYRKDERRVLDQRVLADTTDSIECPED